MRKILFVRFQFLPRRIFINLNQKYVLVSQNALEQMIRLEEPSTQVLANLLDLHFLEPFELKNIKCQMREKVESTADDIV